MSFDIDKIAEPARPLMVQAKHVLGCFSRHFSRKPRPAADCMLLEELVERLEEIHGQLAASEDVEALRDIVGERLVLLRAELEEVRAAPGRHTVEERASFLPERINDQFTLYRTHFAGRDRKSRRIALLRRIVANLEAVLAEIEAPAFAELEHRERYEENQKLVRTELSSMRKELKEIEAEQAVVSLDERIRVLAEAANQEFIAYRARFAGRDRSTLDRLLLGSICDRLGELELQMAEIDRDHGDSVNRIHRRLLGKNLNGYESDYVQITLGARTCRLVDLVRAGATLRDDIRAAEATSEEQDSALAQLDDLLLHPILQRLAQSDG